MATTRRRTFRRAGAPGDPTDAPAEREDRTVEPLLDPVLPELLKRRTEPLEAPLWEQQAATTAVEGERLQKVMAARGHASRRACEILIEERRVTVNGEVAVLGRRVHDDDVIAVDGTPIERQAALVYYVLHKPLGVLSSAKDPHGRPVVVGYVPPEPRVFPVGRLDADTEGLLLLTNDGRITHRITHPSYGVEKEYVAEVHGHPSDTELARLRRGIELDDGPTAPARVWRVRPSTIHVVLHEGRNRQVRRMFEAIEHPVLHLRRTRVGPVVDDTLGPGGWRPLRPEEVTALHRAVGLD
jgi:23S rRNA pseudouridine2605 synthase